MDNSVEPESRHFGAFWDGENNRGREAVRAMPDHTLVTLSPEQSAGLRERLQPVRQAWAQSTPKGAAILRTYEQLLADVRAGR